ncbi:hypothetical protein C0J52_16638 [Blattella germanica]|nr:hypothetical protein C0J52_16638 [Blattella germanica]
MYIYETLNSVKSNLSNLPTNLDKHTYDTRNKNNLFIKPFNTTMYKNCLFQTGFLMYNKLSNYLKEKTAPHKFKKELYNILSSNCSYSIQEFLSDFRSK